MKIEKINSMRHFYSKKDGEHRLNDIFKVFYKGCTVLVIFMNRDNKFAIVIPYIDGIENYILDTTWTLSNPNKSKVVVSNSNNQEFLSHILDKFNFENKDIKYFSLLNDNGSVSIKHIDTGYNILFINDFLKDSYYKDIILSILNFIIKLSE